jgi:acyl carrier protein
MKISNISIGTTFYVLAPGSVFPVTANMAGELCLGGAQLAEGYLNLPHRTDDVFIPNPFGPGRLYRTGDMVILREDGSIELVGRTDYQIKIDGQRVEPNESNAIIQVQPGVATSCVIPALVRGRKSLVALVVSDKTKDWKSLVSGIRGSLRSEIQPYSIPRYWVEMDDLPVNTSGKTDMARLVNLVQTMSEDKLLAPSAQLDTAEGQLKSDVKQVLAEALFLSPSKINPAATFQELGGSSLDAIVLASKLRTIGFNIPVSDILQDLSLHDIFSKPQVAFSGPTEPPAPFSLIPPGSLTNAEEFEDAYPATPLQEGILVDSALGNANYIYQRVFKIQGKTVGQVKNALDEVIHRSPILRTTIKPWKRSFLQMIKPSLAIPWKMIRNQSLTTALEKLSKSPMQLDGPLLRAAVLDSEYLILEMHHSLFDFWSSQFIFADMVALLQNQEPVKRTPFTAYVAYQQTLSEGSDARTFWQEYLNSAPETVLELPLAKDAKKGMVLLADLGDALGEYTRNSGVTIATAIHQAWALTLASHMPTTDVTFMTAFSGRDAEVDGILSLNGPTLCTVPFRIDVGTSVPASLSAKELQKTLWNLAKFAHFGLRNVLSSASMKPGAINTMVNVLAKLEGVDQDGPLVPVITHGDNFTQ